MSLCVNGHITARINPIYPDLQGRRVLTHSYFSASMFQAAHRWPQQRLQSPVLHAQLVRPKSVIVRNSIC
jgi:hypothetical protein